VQANEIEVDQLVFTLLSMTTHSRPCSFAKVIFENKAIEQDSAKGELLFGHHPFSKYLEENIITRYPVLQARVKGNR
jgi:hypothetical protein